MNMKNIRESIRNPFFNIHAYARQQHDQQVADVELALGAVNKGVDIEYILANPPKGWSEGRWRAAIKQYITNGPPNN